MEIFWICKVKNFVLNFVLCYFDTIIYSNAKI